MPSGSTLRSVDLVGLPRSPPLSTRSGWNAGQRLALPGIYVWVSTVLVPTFGGSATALPRALAIGAGALLLLAVCSGWFGRQGRWPLLRGVGIYGFVAACALSWWALAHALHRGWPDPRQAVLGGLGWVLFALSVPDGAAGDPPGQLRVKAIAGVPERAGSLRRSWTFSTLALASLAPLLLAAGVSRDPHASLANVIACAAALSGLALAGGIATSAGTWQTKPHAMRRLGRAWVSLALLVVVLGLGIALKLFDLV